MLSETRKARKYLTTSSWFGDTRHKMLVLVTNDRQNTGSPRCPRPVDQLPSMAKGILQKWLNFYRHWHWRLSWTIQMCPIWSHEFLKVENLFCLHLFREIQRAKDFAYSFWLWIGEKGHEARDTGSLKSWKVQGYRFSCKFSRKVHSPAGTLILARWHHVGFLDSTVR